MKPATHETLDKEQKILHEQLLVAVQEINEADDLIAKHSATSPTAAAANALLLSALARIAVVETAAKHNMMTRLTAFTRQPRS